MRRRGEREKEGEEKEEERKLASTQNGQPTLPVTATCINGETKRRRRRRRERETSRRGRKEVSPTHSFFRFVMIR